MFKGNVLELRCLNLLCLKAKEKGNHLKNILKGIQYGMLDYIEGEEEPQYTADDVTACITLLLEFMSEMASSKQTTVSATEHIDSLILSLNSLNEDCLSCLISADDRQEICTFINKVLIANNVVIKMPVWPE